MGASHTCDTEKNKPRNSPGSNTNRHQVHSAVLVPAIYTTPHRYHTTMNMGVCNLIAALLWSLRLGL